MYHVKNLENNETMEFDSMQEVAQWFNFWEDIYEDGVWDRFIELNQKTYEIKEI